MTKKGFRADSWLIPGFDKPNAKRVQKVYSGPVSAAHSFKPSSHLIPGWKGESLPSQSSVVLSRAVIQLWNEAKRQLSAISRPTKSLASMVHEEFLLYCACRELSLNGLDSIQEFWKHFNDQDSVHFETLNNFRDIYCFRAVTVYLFKIRFLNILMLELQQKFCVAHMANPSNLISKLFRAGGSTELVCDSLKPNCYSWFRPCESTHGQDLEKLRDVLDRTHITEMVKMCSFKTITKEGVDNKDLFEDSPYSHSISHRAFGRLINLNLICMPKWLKEQQQRDPRKKHASLEVIKTKFAGDQLSSLCLSHWLAQEEYVHQNWEEIICPDFVGKDFTDGSFVKICHELQFLTFMVKVAKEQKFPVLNLIANTMREKYERGTNATGQFALFGSDRAAGTGTYKRIVLNLAKPPKNNPHQHLISRIREQLKDLDRDGWLFVLSPQKLFVPSRTDKLQQLLTLAKVHAGINLEGIKGKGEIPHYLYVFSHRDQAISPAGTRESYQHFQWQGELNIFSRFSWFAEELEKFFLTRPAYATPLYQIENEGRQFAFHQDALFEGKLLTSTNNDSSQITHPTFFKNLTGGCVPLDQFFLVEAMDENTSLNPNNQDFLGLLFKPRHHHPLVLVVDSRDPQLVRLELIAAEAYKAKREHYGTAFFHYFGLMPKMPEINPNLFRIFFQSPLGKQLIQLSLGGNVVNLKSKLNSMLIPGFFGIPKYLNDDLKHLVNILEQGAKELLANHPVITLEQFEMAEKLLRDNASKYGWHALSLLANFKVQLATAAQEIEHSPREAVNYHNPLILEPLLKLKSKPLLPHHDDLYVRFVASDRKHLDLTISKTQIGRNEQGHFLELFHEDKLLVELHGNEDFLHFVKFVLSGSIGASLASILQGLHLPSAKELSLVISHYNELSNAIVKLRHKTEALIDHVLHSHLNHA